MVYGGQIDNAHDQEVLLSLVTKYFTAAAFEHDYSLVDAGETELLVPEATNMPQFMEWVNNLPEREPPTWLGLPPNAHEVLQSTEGRRILNDIHKIQHSLRS